MAARHRNAVHLKSEMENATRVAAVKGAAAKPLGFRRPALNDLDRNRVQNNAPGLMGPQKPASKLQRPLVPKKLVVKPKERQLAVKEVVVEKLEKPEEVRVEDVTSKTDETFKADATLQQEVKDEAEEEEDRVGYSTALMEDPDLDVQDNPQLVAEYTADIFNYLRHLEEKYPIKQNFLDGHQSSPWMRSVLVNWLVQVHQNFKLCLETLYMAVSITDRYLQENQHIGRETLQLVGTSGLLVACKYEEMYFPELVDFVYICDDTFSRKQILKMELDILNKLGCCLGRPVPITFLRRYSKIAKVSAEQHTMSKYLLELSLVDYEFCHVKPSMQAAAASCLAISILNGSTPQKAWSLLLSHHSGYEYSEIEPSVIRIAQLVLKAETSKHKAVKEKYASSTHSLISLHPRLKSPMLKKLTET